PDVRSRHGPGARRVIARCDRCDARSAAAGFPLSASGHRWDPAKAGLGLWRCSTCGSPLRAKRKGETEANIIEARLPNPPPVAPGINIRKTGRLAGDVERERRKKRTA